MREGGHFEDPGGNGRIILKQIFKNCHGGINRIDVAQDRDRWRASVSAVINFGFHKMQGIS
jgi:hypothetical protein